MLTVCTCHASWTPYVPQFIEVIRRLEQLDLESTYIYFLVDTMDLGAGKRQLKWMDGGKCFELSNT